MCLRDMSVPPLMLRISILGFIFLQVSGKNWLVCEAFLTRHTPNCSFVSTSRYGRSLHHRHSNRELFRPSENHGGETKRCSSLSHASTVLRSTEDNNSVEESTNMPDNHSAVASTDAGIPREAKHPVLQQILPDLMANIEKYGHPNIPLGTSAGKRCSTLRRLYLENKLSSNDISLLEDLGFALLSFDDIYYEADFDDMLKRLQSYESENQTGYQIPKKYKPDPQLGAWVTNLRRLGPEGVSSEHRRSLDAINFAWKSTRACGSSFMKAWRSTIEELSALQSISNEESESKVSIDISKLSSDTTKWLKAQVVVYSRGDMSETRQTYMDKLTVDFGIDWKGLPQ